MHSREFNGCFDLITFNVCNGKGFGILLTVTSNGFSALLKVMIILANFTVPPLYPSKHSLPIHMHTRIDTNIVIFLCRYSPNFDSLISTTFPGRPIVSAHRRILGLASVVCVLVKIRVSSISLYKLDTDKLTAPFESAHQFTLVCTVSDSKTVPGCHYNLCSNHSFVLTD